MPAKFTKLVLLGGKSFPAPDYFHAHTGGGFILGYKGKPEVFTVPASAVAYTVVTYSTVEEAEKAWEPAAPDPQDEPKGDTNGQRPVE